MRKQNSRRYHLQNRTKTNTALFVCGAYAIVFLLNLSRNSDFHRGQTSVETDMIRLSNDGQTDRVAKMDIDASPITSRKPYLAQPSKFLVVTPFTTGDLTTLLVNLDRRGRLGPACDAGRDEDNRSDLWFYYSKSSRELPGEFVRFQSSQVYHKLHTSFSRVRIAFANLTSEEDYYPVGINLMFFRLVAGMTHAHELEGFRTMFWMEPDVKPIKPYWLDALVRESNTDDDFWIKGSVYLGDSFDGSAGNDWTLTGHINGNALYRLHQPDFSRFLQIVMELEPPDDIGKPFDVSIWKVLHDFPYFWHAYQRIAKHFVYVDFIEHWGFTITDDHKDLSSRNPRTFFVHGQVLSSGKQIFLKNARMNASRSSEDSIIETTEDSISVFMRSQMTDAEYAMLAVYSVINYMDWALEIVVVVPISDVSTFLQQLGPQLVSTNKIRVVAEEPLVTGEAHPMQQAYTRSTPDTYCHGEFIFHMRPDSVMVRKVLRKDFFFAGKPIMRYSSYADLPEHARLWGNGTANALGDDVRSSTYVPVAANERVMPRELYLSFRSHVERIHSTSFRSFMQTRVAPRFCSLNGRVGDCPFTRNQAQKYRRAFSDSIALGAYVLTRKKDAATWLPLEGSHDYALQIFVPIITRFTCQGHALLAHKLGQTRNDIQGLKSAMHSGNCDHVNDWRLAGQNALMF